MSAYHISEPLPDYDCDNFSDTGTDASGGDARVASSADEPISASTDEGIDAGDCNKSNDSRDVRKSIRIIKREANSEAAPASCEAESSKSSEEMAVSSLLPPPPPPPPPPQVVCLRPEDEAGEGSRRTGGKGADALKGRGKAAVLFLPPPFLSPPSSDQNIKPSEYLKQVAVRRQQPTKQQQQQQQQQESVRGEPCFRVERQALLIQRSVSEAHLLSSSSQETRDGTQASEQQSSDQEREKQSASSPYASSLSHSPTPTSSTPTSSSSTSLSGEAGGVNGSQAERRSRQATDLNCNQKDRETEYFKTDDFVLRTRPKPPHGESCICLRPADK